MKELDKLKTKLYTVGGCKKLVQETKQRKERKKTNIYSMYNDNRKIKARKKQQKWKLHLLNIKIK